MAVQLPHHNYFLCVRAPFDLWAEEELTKRNASPGAKRCKLKDFMNSAHSLFAALAPTTQADYERRYLEHCRVQGVVLATPAKTKKTKKRERRSVSANSIQKKTKQAQAATSVELPAETESLRIMMESAAPVSAVLVPAKAAKLSVRCSITPQSRNITLEVEADDTISTMKVMLQEKVGIPADQQRLVFAGKYLDDENSTLRHCNIQNDATVHLVRRTLPKPLATFSEICQKVCPSAKPAVQINAEPATGGGWTVVADQASLLLRDWTPQLAKHSVSLCFKSGVVALGFSQSAKPRTVILNSNHSSCLVSGGRVEITKHVRVEITLNGQGCSGCCGDEVYRFQLQQGGAKESRLKVKCFSDAQEATSQAAADMQPKEETVQSTQKAATKHAAASATTGQAVTKAKEDTTGCGCPKCGDAHAKCNDECLEGGCECPKCGHYDTTPQPWGRAHLRYRVNEITYWKDNPELDNVADRDHGDFASMEEAVACAIKVRKSSEYFCDWPDDDDELPFDSYRMENDDNDQEVSINIRDLGPPKHKPLAAVVSKVSGNTNQATTVHNQTASQSKIAPITASVIAPHTGSFGPVYDAHTKAEKAPSGDPGRTGPASARFLAAPTNPKLKSYPVNKWSGPVGFVHLISRMSDLCYAVAAYCCDPSRGAQYTLLKVPRVYCKALVWLPPMGHTRGGANAPPAASLVDAVSPDLFLPGSNPPQSNLTASNLRNAVNTQTQFLFVNSLHDADGLAAAIDECGPLQCVCLIETTISVRVLQSLAQHGKSLRGLHLHMCKSEGEDTPVAAMWCQLLRSAMQLLWWYVEGAAVGESAFRNIPASLKVLGYEGEHDDALRAALPQLSRQLTHLMVNMKHTGSTSIKLPPPVPFKLYGIRHTNPSVRGVYDSWDQVQILRGKYAELKNNKNTKKFEDVNRELAQKLATEFSEGDMQLPKAKGFIQR